MTLPGGNRQIPMRVAGILLSMFCMQSIHPDLVETVSSSLVLALVSQYPLTYLFFDSPVGSSDHFVWKGRFSGVECLGAYWRGRQTASLRRFVVQSSELTSGLDDVSIIAPLWCI